MRIRWGLRPVTLVFAMLLFSLMMTLPSATTTGQTRWSCSTHSAASRRNGESRKHRAQQRVFFGPSTLGLRGSFKRSEGRNSLSTVGKGIERISPGHSVEIRSRRILPPTGRAAGDDNAVSLPVHSTAGGEAHSDHIRRRHTHLAQHLYGWTAASGRRQAQSDLDRPFPRTLGR